MKFRKFNPKTYFVFLALAGVVFVGVHGNTFLPAGFDPEQFSANLARIWIKSSNVEPVLLNYPFPLLSPSITVAEGFESYDGNLGDIPEAPHWAIDYVQKSGDKFLSFPVFSAHDGVVFQGFGKTWGKFVVVRKRGDLSASRRMQGYNTLYSHLDNIPESIPFMNSDIDNSEGIFLVSGTFIGDASVTGNTKGINQLHFEFHIVDTKTSITLRADPYGVYKRLSSRLYPQPGSSLFGLSHYWSNNFPPFATK
ncbi:M23 family metallopeptidase [Candidatus Parcubacteria bacterium]|nr:M23 family metallopeptidase [Candidatus Parcubacteria bacterium]